MFVHVIVRPQFVRADSSRRDNSLAELGVRLEVEEALPYDVKPLQSLLIGSGERE